MHIEGHYTILLARNGITDEYAFDNLIMDGGLAVLRGYMNYQGEWFSTAPGYSVKLSTDAATPVVGETLWPLAVASSTTIVDRGFGQNITVQPYYSEWSIAAEFAPNAFVGDVHSVVVTANYRGTSTPALFSRALLRNRLGTIAPLTLIPGDQVTILYRQRIYPNLVQTSGTLVKDSVAYDWVSNPVQVDQPGGALSSLSLPVAAASYSQFPKGVLTYDRSIVCCLNFEGVNGSSPVGTLDESGFVNTIASIGGNPVISTTQAKFGSSSMYFDGTGDYANIGRNANSSYHPAMMMRHAPTTVSCWVRFPTWAHTTNRVASLLHPSGSYHGWYMSVGSDGSGAMSILASSANQLVLTSPPSTIPLNQWCHLAISHNGAGGWTLMVNGTVYGRGYYVLANATNAAHRMYLGTVSGDGVNDIPNMYLDNFVVATKQLWDPTISVPTAVFPVNGADPYWGNVTLRVPFEPLTTSFVDLAKNYLSPYGNAALSAAQAKYGSTSIAFDGTGDFLIAPYSADYSALTDDMTYELWVYPTTLVKQVSLLSVRGVGGINSEFQLGLGTTGTVDVTAWGVSNSVVVTASSVDPLPAANQWYHIALVKTAVHWTVYVDGALALQVASTGPVLENTQNLHIGRDPTTSARDFVGYIADIRITKGVVRYPEPFDAPTESLALVGDPYADDVVLMVSGDGAAASLLIENVIPKPSIPVGSGVVYASDVQTQYLPASGYLPGTSLSGATNALQPYLVPINSSDFTVEAWVYITSTTAVSIWWDSRDTDATTLGFVVYAHGTNRLAIGTGNPVVTTTGATPVTLNTWHHAVVTRRESTIRGYLDGLIQFAIVNSSAFTNPSAFIGRSVNATAITAPMYVSDLRVDKGLARYASGFTPPTSALTAIASTTLLLACDGADLSTVFTDSSTGALTVTAGGNAKLSTAVVKFGTAAAKFDGTGDYLSVPANAAFGFGTADFTIECWINMIALPTSGNTMTLLDTRTGMTATPGTWFIENAAGVYQLGCYGGSPTASARWATGAITTGVWYHVAWVRQNGVVQAYLDGAQLGATTGSPSATGAINFGSSQPAKIGTAQDGTTGAWNGYIDSLRIVKGVAVYTMGFTPPTQALSPTDPDYEYAVMHVPFNGAPTQGMHDVTANRLPPQVAGAVVVNTPSPFSAPAMSLPGSTYISYPHTAGLVLNGDFTIELWVYPTARPTMACILDKDGLFGSYHASYFIGVRNTGRVAYALGSVDATGLYEGTLTVPLNEWTHIAMVVSGPRVMGFVGGKLDMCASVQPTYVDRGLPLLIGYSAGQTLASNTFFGYLADIRITKGVARYTASYTVPTAPIMPNLVPTAAYPTLGGLLDDPYIDKVMLHMPFNGDAGSYANLCTTPPALATTSSIQYSTAAVTSTVNNGYHTTSAYYPAARTGVLGTDLPAFRDTDFTIEAWIMHPGAWDGTYVAANDRTIFGNTSAANYQTYVALRSDTGLLSYWNNATTVLQSNGPYVTPGQWAHIAVCRAQNTIYLFVNGVGVGSGVVTVYHANQPDEYIMGDAGAGNRNFTGYINDLRVTHGVARYVGAGFTQARVQGVFPTPNTTYPAAVSAQGVVGGQYQLAVEIPAGPAIAAGVGGVAMYNTPAVAPQYTYPHGVWSQLLFEGVDGQAVFTDTGYVGTSWTPTGAPALTTAQAKFGTTSLYLDGSSYLRTTLTTHRAQLTSNFTVMAWVRLTAYTAGGYCPILTAGSDAGSTAYTHLSVTSTGGLRARGWSGSADMFNVVSPDGYVLLNTWTHVAFIRAGTTITLYVNGTSAATSAIALPNVPQCGTAYVQIGRGWNGTATVNMSGYIDSLAISSGVEYTANFAVPTTPYTVPDYAGEASGLLDGRGVRQVAAFTPPIPKGTSDSYDVVMGGTVARYD